MQNHLGCRALSFAFGLATTLALLGVASSALGRTYGQVMPFACLRPAHVL